jgi:hypothetical protein
MVEILLQEIGRRPGPAPKGHNGGGPALYHVSLVEAWSLVLSKLTRFVDGDDNPGMFALSICRA